MIFVKKNIWERIYVALKLTQFANLGNKNAQPAKIADWDLNNAVFLYFCSFLGCAG